MSYLGNKKLWGGWYVIAVLAVVSLVLAALYNTNQKTQEQKVLPDSSHNNISENQSPEIEKEYHKAAEVALRSQPNQIHPRKVASAKILEAPSVVDENTEVVETSAPTETQNNDNSEKNAGAEFPFQLSAGMSFRSLVAEDSATRAKAKLNTKSAFDLGFSWTPKISRETDGYVLISGRFYQFSQPASVARLSDASPFTAGVETGIQQSVLRNKLRVKLGIGLQHFLGVSGVSSSTLTFDHIRVPYLASQIATQVYSYEDFKASVEVPLSLLFPGASTAYTSKFGFQGALKLRADQRLKHSLFGTGLYYSRSFLPTSRSKLIESNWGMDFIYAFGGDREKPKAD